MVDDNIPLVSVILPVYNGEQYLGDAIDSVLGQTYSNIEIVAVDDGSTDNTPVILETYTKQAGILSFAHEKRRNRGVSHSRKLAVDKAQGDYIAFLDADDIFLPEKIARQVEVFEAHPDVILCHHDVEQLAETKKSPLGKDRFTLAGSDLQYVMAEEPYYLVRNYICNPTVMVRSSTLQNLPFYSRQLFQFEDWLMWILLAEYGPFLFLPDKLTRYRYHAASATADIVSNPLVWYYSHVELLLCAISRLNSKYLQNQAYIQLQAILMNLFMEYMKDDEALSEDVLADTTTFGKKLFTSSPQDLEKAAIAALNPKNLAKHMPIDQLGLALIMKAVYRLRETE
jgi:glycosyltransferase involved in cell wall biosynthesis